MIEVKADMREKTTAISAAGSLGDLLIEYAMITGAFVEQLLGPFTTDAECDRIKDSFLCAIGAGVARGIENHKKEVKKRESN